MDVARLKALVSYRQALMAKWYIASTHSYVYNQRDATIHKSISSNLQDNFTKKFRETATLHIQEKKFYYMLLHILMTYIHTYLFLNLI